MLLIRPDLELDRRIAALALPALGAIAAEPAYSLADTAIVGHLGRAALGSLVFTLSRSGLSRASQVRRTPRSPAKLRRLRRLRQVHLVVGRLPHFFSTRNSRRSCSAFSLPKRWTISSHNADFRMFSW